MRTLDRLIAAIHDEAKRTEFPVDQPVYDLAKKDSSRPILYAGSLRAPVCVFGRDLGKDEVALGEPLVGAGGRLVRSCVYEAIRAEKPPKSDRRLEPVLEHILLTNTVPYKPPGNKAYSDAVKDRFRPFLLEFLTNHWKGDRVITLGNEAFQWFVRYAEPGAAEELWKRADRYEADLRCILPFDLDGQLLRKCITVCPLPHPSPLNARWSARFPELLAKRLKPA
jgi:uracil-DNA glycosylase